MDFAPFVMIVCIVAIVFGASIAKTWMRTRQMTSRNADQDRELADVKAEVARLSDRVKTLERIAVDADRQLSAEISKLR